MGDTDRYFPRGLVGEVRFSLASCNSCIETVRGNDASCVALITFEHSVNAWLGNQWSDRFFQGRGRGSLPSETKVDYNLISFNISLP